MPSAWNKNVVLYAVNAEEKLIYKVSMNVLQLMLDYQYLWSIQEFKSNLKNFLTSNRINCVKQLGDHLTFSS